MKELQYTVKQMDFSTYISIEGDLGYKAAADFRKIIPTLISPKKDLYLDIKSIDNIDITGLNCLITTKFLVNIVGGELLILVNNQNRIFKLMDQIKLKDQLNFRKVIIQDSYLSVAS